MLVNNLICDFSASYSGGGLKRFEATVRYMESRGGCIFFVNKRVFKRFDHFKNSIFVSVDESKLERLLPISLRKLYLIFKLNLKNFHYYSYGIPVVPLFGCRSSHLHISNVLPFHSRSFGFKFSRRLQLIYLGLLFKFVFPFYGKITVESEASISYMPRVALNKIFVSPNGVDEEIEMSSHISEDHSGILSQFIPDCKNFSYAIAIGLQPYKNIEKCIDIFQSVKSEYRLNGLLVVGGHGTNYISTNEVFFLGELGRESVHKLLKASQLYISCTSIENSYNAAAEGALLSNATIFSSIPVHLEFVNLLGCEYELVSYFSESFIKLSSRGFDVPQSLTWDKIIADDLEEFVSDKKSCAF